MKNLLDALKGKKTFIVCGATLVYAVLGLMLGHLEPSGAANLVVLALTGAGLRDALNSNVK